MFRYLHGIPLYTIGKHYIYVIGSEEGPKKIGYTGNLIARINSIQSASSIKLCLFYKYRVESSNAPQIEKTVHLILDAHRLHGEWFNCDLPQIKIAIEETISKFSAAVSDTEKSKLESNIEQDSDRKPWTIKAVPVEVRKKAITCVTKRGETMGVWIARAVDTQAEIEAGESSRDVPNAAPLQPCDRQTIEWVMERLRDLAAMGLPISEKQASAVVDALIRCLPPLS